MKKIETFDNRPHTVVLPLIINEQDLAVFTCTNLRTYIMVETKFNVGMTCEGCAAAVKRILGKIEGVESVETNVDAKSVIVQANAAVAPSEMLEKLQKWGSASGKSVELVQ